MTARWRGGSSQPTLPAVERLCPAERVHQALYDRRSRAGTSDVWHCEGGGRGLLHHDERECLGRSDARVTFRSIGATLSGGEPPIRIGRRTLAAACELARRSA